MALVPCSDEYMEKCICGECQTYTATACPLEKEEGFYCSCGWSDCEISKKSCRCPGCVVFREFSLTGDFFCINGEAE